MITSLEINNLGWESLDSTYGSSLEYKFKNYLLMHPKNDSSSIIIEIINDNPYNNNGNNFTIFNGVLYNIECLELIMKFTRIL